MEGLKVIKFKNADIAKILPENFRTPEVESIGYALKQMQSRILNCVEKSMVYATIEKLPEKILDVLAVELRTPYYDQKLPLDKKQYLIKNALYLHSKAGTPEAIEEMIHCVFDNGELHEWFEYGGNPYCFRVTVNVGSVGIDDKTEYAIEEKMKNFKNLRSHCDGIIYIMEESPAIVKVVSTSAIGEVIRVKPKLEEFIKTNARENTLGKTTLEEYIRAKPLLQYYIKPGEAKANVTAGTLEANRLKVKAKLEDKLKSDSQNFETITYQKIKNKMTIKKEDK